MVACPPLVIPSLARDLYVNIVIIIIEILRLRFAPLRMTRKGSCAAAPLRMTGRKPAAPLRETR